MNDLVKIKVELTTDERFAVFSAISLKLKSVDRAMRSEQNRTVSALREVELHELEQLRMKFS